jgi:hypothetical protein
LNGKICCSCKSMLPPPHVRGERLCLRCLEERAPRRRIYMHFMLRNGWYCQFLEEDLKTPLPKKLNLKEPAKIFEIAERGGYKLTLENRQSIEHAIEKGRGSIWLDLTPEQYQKLAKK